jgi:hypothetical protein
MFLHVIKVRYLKGYKLRLMFSTGVVKDVDLEAELYGEVFEPLKDKALFKQVKVNRETNTIQWPTGADFAPEYLDEIGEVVSSATAALVSSYL